MESKFWLEMYILKIIWLLFNFKFWLESEMVSNKRLKSAKNVNSIKKFYNFSSESFQWLNIDWKSKSWKIW